MAGQIPLQTLDQHEVEYLRYQAIVEWMEGARESLLK
jgi:hypothetical protein